MPEIKLIYTENVEKFKKVIKSKSDTLRWLSFFRLISFLSILYLLYKMIPDPYGYQYLFLLCVVVLFMYLVKKSVVIADLRKFYQELIYVNRNELSILSGEKNGFDDGKEYSQMGGFAEDLDIFGPGSLFQLLNRTTTSHGKERLAKILTNPDLDRSSIRKTQSAIQVLSSQADLCHNIIATGLVDREKEGTLNDLTEWLKISSKITQLAWVQVLRFLFPPIAILSFLFYLSSNNYIPLLITTVIAWVITGIFRKYIQQQHMLLAKKNDILQQYARILKEFHHVHPGDSDLLREKKTVAGETFGAIFRLSKLTGLFDQRNNLLVNFFMNSFFLYDIQCTVLLEKWKQKHAPEYDRWIECICNIETLTSLSAFSRNHPGYCIPEISEEKRTLKVLNMGHPFLEGSAMVTNDLIPAAQEKIFLITGSNMSGKTTFLRSAGINLILAQCGAPVCATSFSFSPMQILSSIRINDSLQEHTSYFMAELIRLKEISEKLKSGITSLVLVDEILRGTNSDDKTYGSAAFITGLLPYECIALFATHDLSLSGLEDEYPGMITNYSFESNIENDNLSFDYKLRKGIAKHKNASFLMKKMGIIQ